MLRLQSRLVALLGTAPGCQRETFVFVFRLQRRANFFTQSRAHSNDVTKVDLLEHIEYSDMRDKLVAEEENGSIGPLGKVLELFCKFGCYVLHYDLSRFGFRFVNTSSTVVWEWLRRCFSSMLWASLPLTILGWTFDQSQRIVNYQKITCDLLWIIFPGLSQHLVESERWRNRGR